MTKRYTDGDFITLTPQEANFVIEYNKDWNPRRAAAVSGIDPDTAFALTKKDHIHKAIQYMAKDFVEAQQIDAEWVLMELYDNHRIARFNNEITASNTALKSIAQHTMVDAFASDKLNMNIHGDAEIMKRLLRGRDRNSRPVDTDDEVSFL